MERIGSSEAVIEFIGLLVALATFFITSRMDRKATQDQTYRETLRATLKEFSDLRRVHQSFPNNLGTLGEEDRRLAIREYLADLERFAVGCNMGAYDIEIVNKMSGGSLVGNYRKYFKLYIENARRNLKPTSPIHSEHLYVEVEKMMQKLHEVRGDHFYPIINYPEDERILERFLELPISSTDCVFSLFRTLPNSIESHGEGKEGYLYVPGD